MEGESSSKKTDAVAPIEADPILQMLVGMFSELESDKGLDVFTLTFYVSGLIICGHVVGPASFWKEVQRFYAQFGTGADSLGRSFTEPLLAFIEKERESNSQKDSATPKLAQYIYLLNAKVLYQNGMAVPTGQGMPLRIRISAVNGFSFGELVPGK